MKVILDLKRSYFAFLLLLSFGCSAHDNAKSQLSESAWKAIHKFESRIRQDVEGDDIGSITVAVVKGKEILEAKSFGWADRERRIRATPEHIYRIGSITKSLTAVLMMQFVEKGVFQLDEPVEKHLPEIKNLIGYAEHPPLTFRQLASHTSGLICEPKLPRNAYGPIEEWENKVLMSIPTTSFFAPPGEKYEYCNIGYGILGLAISRAAGKPFTDLMHELMFAPLEMHHTTFVINNDLAERLTKGYVVRKNSVSTEVPAREHAGRGYRVPSGGAYSTVVDLTKFMAAQTGSSAVQILSAEGRAELQRIQTPASEPDPYGLGFSIRIAPDGLKTVAHSGSISGYAVYYVFEPQSEFGVILLRNYNLGSTKLWRAGRWLLLTLVRLESHTPGHLPTNIHELWGN